MLKKISFITILTFLALSNIHAELCKPVGKFYVDNNRGWFFMEYCEPEKEAKVDNETEGEERKDVIVEQTPKDKFDKLSSTKVEIPWDILNDLDPDSIRNLQEDSQKIVIMRPTEENVVEYKRLIAWIMQKSTDYMNANTVASKLNPEFSGVGGAQGTSTYGVNAKGKIDAYFKKKIMAKYKENTALVVLESSHCQYCRFQKPIVEAFGRKYGWEYQFIDIEEKPYVAKKLGTQTTPDLFIIHRDKQEQPRWQRIGSGVHAQDEIVDGIILGLQVLGLEPKSKYIGKLSELSY